MTEIDSHQPVPNPKLAKRYFRYYTYIEPVFTDPIIKGYFTLVASLLLIAFFIFFALSPTFSTILGLTRKIQDQKKLRTDLDAKISALIIAQENYSQAEPHLPTLLTALPEQSQPDVVFNGILKAASSSGATLTLFQFNPVELQKVPAVGNFSELTSSPSAENSVSSSLGVTQVAFQVQARGTKEQLRQLAGDLEFLPRLVKLQTIALSHDITEKGNPNTFTADIIGAAYAFNLTEPESTPSADQVEPNLNQR